MGQVGSGLSGSDVGLELETTSRRARVKNVMVMVVSFILLQKGNEHTGGHEDMHVDVA